ncbi:hypothetical protein AAFC00_000595 [Neodothiora populina]
MPAVASEMQHSRAHQYGDAEWLKLPQDRVVTLEHPCIVNDVDKAIKSLGGEQHMKNLLAPCGQTLPVGLSLRPHDTLAKKLVSREVPVQNILLRVTLPKCTGRKRKRGSGEPFVYPVDQDRGVVASHSPDAPLLLQHLRDNADRYTIQPIGPVKETHRFRSLPDFQIKSGTQTVMSQIGQHLVDASLASIKRFDLDTTPGIRPGEEMLPPPSFTNLSQTMNYSYKQNQGASTVTDAQGHVKAVNLQKPKKRAVLAVPADTEHIPTGPPPDLTALEDTNVYLEQAVKNISALLEKRPVVTRRVAMNLIDWGSESLFKEATQYVGYSFKSGPWRDALVKWGIDPRKDPKYRIYQTLSFQLMSKDKMMAEAKMLPDGRNTWIRSERYRKDEQPSHIFDGNGITTNGKTWQICDIKEPLIKRLLDTNELRDTCDNESCGWYHNGTMSKVRIIMRDMIGMMLLGQAPDTATYEKLCTIPNIIDPSTYAGCYFSGSTDGEKVVKLSSEIRNIAKTNMILRAKIRAAVTRDQGDQPPVAASDHDADDGRQASLEAHQMEAVRGEHGGAVNGMDDDGDFDVEGDDLNASDAEAEEDAGEDEDED